jgi:hypothetical protein
MPLTEEGVCPRSRKRIGGNFIVVAIIAHSDRVAADVLKSVVRYHVMIAVMGNIDRVHVHGISLPILEIQKVTILDFVVS